jgi:hypothetical protein
MNHHKSVVNLIPVISLPSQLLLPEQTQFNLQQKPPQYLAEFNGVNLPSVTNRNISSNKIKIKNQSPTNNRRLV